MSSLGRIQIQGIRSFNPASAAGSVVCFYKPLTIIVGPNGSGKTTIIEALKYACTGELPPSTGRGSGGHSFVHDPKLCKEGQVRAQIKLKFNNVRGQDMLVVRNMQLTQRASKLEFKAQESALVIRDPTTREKVSLSCRCADIDRQVPEFLGVTRAVLNHVIFCHQEESNWPLQADTKLKQHFDEIFSATKYTKALETIHKYRKELDGQIKDLRHEQDMVRLKKDQATKTREEIRLNERRMEDLDREMEVVQREIEETAAKVDELQGIKATMGRLEEERAHWRSQHEVMSREKDELYDRLDSELIESDEEIQTYLRKFTTTMETIRSTVSHKELVLKEIEERQGSLQRAHYEQSKRHARLIAERDSHMRTRQHRDQLIREIARRYQWHEFLEENLAPDAVVRFADKLQAAEARHSAEVTRLKEDFRRAEEEERAAYSKLHAEMKYSDQAMRDKRDQLDTAMREARSLRDDLARSKADAGNPEELQSRVRDLEAKVASRDDSRQLAELQRRMDDATRRRDELQTRIRELSTIQKTRAQLRVRREDLKRAEADLAKALDSSRPRLSKHLGADLHTESADVQISQALRTTKAKLETVAARHDALSRELAGLSGETAYRQKDLGSLESQLRDLKRQLGTHNRLPEEIQQAEAKVLKRRDDLQRTKVSCIFFEKYIDLAQKHHECPLCDRGFNDHELHEFVRKAQDKIREAPTYTRRCEQAVERAERQKTELAKLRPVWEQIQRLEERLPKVRTEHEALAQRCEQLQRDVEEVKAERVQLQALRESLEQALPEAQNLASLHQRAVRCRNAANDEERRILTSLGWHGEGDGAAPQDDDAAFEAAQRECQQVEQEVRRLGDELQTRRTEHDRLSSKLREARQQHQHALQTVRSCERTQRALTEREQTSAQLQTDLQETEQLVASLRSRLREAEQRLHDAVQKRRENEQAFQETSDRMRADLAKISGSADSIKPCAIDYDGQIAQQEVELERTQGQTEELEKQHRGISEELNAKRKTLSEQSSLERNITDNLRYRAKAAEVERLEQRIQEVEAQIDAIPGARECLDTLAARTQEHADLVTKMASRRSKHDVYQTFVKQKRAQINREYRNVDNAFRQILIKLKTTELARADIHRYHVALERALMKYHSVKMADINQIIRELWQRTYRGGDIDYIEIRSDIDRSTADASATARGRAYTYRLVMVKSGVELDMRGRCSAGQKELASLVIRLALAETFCLKCGMLALDEPTANLDRANVESFADSLIKLIDTLGRQNNFQLIVITHDEEFVQHLSRGNYCDYYWRVAKDEHNHSIVERQEMYRLT